VLERGEIANSWLRERWPSLRLLTPNWQCRLPGLHYGGQDPDGYMTSAEVADLLANYATYVQAPVQQETDVISLRRTDEGYLAHTSQGDVYARTVVVASGAANLPSVPSFAEAIPSHVVQLTPFAYDNPSELPDAAVLVVGASATGVQLAAEVRLSGRDVVLSVGEHVRLPRTYRGRDVLWWMEMSGVWDQRYDEVEDLSRARRLPSPQLVGTPQRTTLDLNALISMDVELVGRWATVRDGKALFSGGLRNVCALADLKLDRLLGTFDEWALAEEPELDLETPERPTPTHLPRSTRLELDLRSGEIGTIIWATGFRPDYGWLDVPVVDHKGNLRHDGGAVDSPGLYALGLPVLRRRKSTFIVGIEDDAREVIMHLDRYVAGAQPATAR
jgi:putative flavoprotein involved in K+ transport